MTTLQDTRHGGHSCCLSVLFARGFWTRSVCYARRMSACLSVWNRKSLAASGLRSRTQTSSDLLVASSSSSSHSVWQHLRRDVWGLILNKRSNLPCQTTGERAGMVSSVGMHVWREREKRERRSRNMNVFRFDRIRTGIGNTTKPWRPKIT
jgi:hypothetical protein